MHDETSRLVDREHRVILVDDVEVEGLSEVGACWRRIQEDVQALAFDQPLRRTRHRHVVDADAAAANPALNAGARQGRQPGQPVHEHVIHAPAGVAAIDDDPAAAGAAVSVTGMDPWYAVRRS